MKYVARSDLLEFEIALEKFAFKCKVKTKDDLEWFSALLHDRLEIAMHDYATDFGIKDYEKQY